MKRSSSAFVSIRTAFVILTLSAASGCAVNEMLPGAACGSCHVAGSSHAFGAAGTVYASRNGGDGASDVTIRVTDSTGQSVTMTSNRVGNFFTTQRLTPPLEVTLSRDGGVSASMTAERGDCNSCHADRRSPGRLAAP